MQEWCLSLSSGTASMEASVINAFDENDKVLVVNGGSFGTALQKSVRCMEYHIQRLK